MPNLRVPVNFQGAYDATSLITHMGKSTTTLCACFHMVSPIDSSVVAMTSYSSNLIGVPGYPSVTFKHTTGVTASNIEGYANQAAQMTVDAFLVAAGITEADLLAGKWSHALATLFITNYEALDMGQLIIQYGYLGELVQKGVYVTAEIKGLNNALTAQIGTVTRPECLHEFGDAGCTLDLSALGFIKTGSLTTVTSQTVFRDSARTETGDYFQNGLFTFTSGSNNGYMFVIDSWDATNKEFVLRTPAPYLPTNGTTYSAKRGCRKRAIDDCATKFSNILNFKGFPHMDIYENIVRLPQS